MTIGYIISTCHSKMNNKSNRLVVVVKHVIKFSRKKHHNLFRPNLHHHNHKSHKTRHTCPQKHVHLALLPYNKNYQTLNQTNTWNSETKSQQSTLQKSEWNLDPKSVFLIASDITRIQANTFYDAQLLDKGYSNIDPRIPLKFTWKTKNRTIIETFWNKFPQITRETNTTTSF
jgi:hypothetical protein